MPVVCGFNDKARDILPTIGKGEINITSNSQGGLEYLNYDVNGYIGATTAEHASLHASVPVSDMVQFVQSIIKPTPTVNIATTESEESGEPQNQKLTDYNKRINEQLENHSILPSGLSEKDAVLVSKIAQEVQEQYPNLAKADQDKKVAQSYFLVKECQEHPEKAPPMQLAAAAVAIPIIDFAWWLIGVIVAYKAAEDAPKIARILLDSEESEEYNELDKFEKKRHGGKNNPLPTPKLADFGAPNIDPDDFEPEEEGKERKFNCEKAESPVWKELKNFKNAYGKEIRTNNLSGKERRFYQWDKQHNDIEVYGPGGRNHLGSADPFTGEIYKPGVPGRNIVKELR